MRIGWEAVWLAGRPVLGINPLGGFVGKPPSESDRRLSPVTGKHRGVFRLSECVAGSVTRLDFSQRFDDHPEIRGSCRGGPPRPPVPVYRQTVASVLRGQESSDRHAGGRRGPPLQNLCEKSRLVPLAVAELFVPVLDDADRGRRIPLDWRRGQKTLTVGGNVILRPRVISKDQVG